MSKGEKNQLKTPLRIYSIDWFRHLFYFQIVCMWCMTSKHRLPWIPNSLQAETGCNRAECSPLWNLLSTEQAKPERGDLGAWGKAHLFTQILPWGWIHEWVIFCLGHSRKWWSLIHFINMFMIVFVRLCFVILGVSCYDLKHVHILITTLFSRADLSSTCFHKVRKSFFLGGVHSFLFVEWDGLLFRAAGV